MIDVDVEKFEICLELIQQVRYENKGTKELIKEKKTTQNFEISK